MPVIRESGNDITTPKEEIMQNLVWQITKTVCVLQHAKRLNNHSTACSIFCVLLLAIETPHIPLREHQQRVKEAGALYIW